MTDDTRTLNLAKQMMRADSDTSVGYDDVPDDHLNDAIWSDAPQEERDWYCCRARLALIPPYRGDSTGGESHE